MREIKFRAWDTNHKKWYTRVQVGTNCGHAVYDEEREMWLEFDEFCGVVVQWTGLTDRNGKEIYEGDIMRGYNAFGESFAQLTVITWDKEEACWTGCDWSDLKGEEVIGNIYEHSELINS